MKTTPAQFVRQVKQEIAKITWPTRKEALQGTVVVSLMSMIIALFLFVIDLVFAGVVRWIIGG